MAPSSRRSGLRWRSAWLGPALLLMAAVYAWLPRGLSFLGAVPLSDVPPDTDLSATLQKRAQAVAHTWIATHPPHTLAFRWGEGVLAFGLERTFQEGGNPEIRDYLRSYLGHHLARGISVRSSDDATPALAAAERALHADREFTELVAKVAQYALQAPRTTRAGLWLHLGRAPWPVVRELLPEAWIDSVFHLVPALLRYSTLSGAARYRDLAAAQLQAFCVALQDPRTGLFTHAYDDTPRERRVPAFEARAFWARGNGWMLATLVDTLGQLPAAHPARAQLMAAFERARIAVQKTQAASGLFHTLLLRTDSYQETAGSALIVYALARGLRLGLLPSSVRAAAVRGARGLLSVVRVRGASTEITGTSLGTNPIAALYTWTPTADQIDYGVGAWLMAASELAPLLATDGREPTR